MSTKRASWLAAAILLCPAMAAAGRDRPAVEAPPSLELLEFLGEWETKDGDWVDPMQFVSPAGEADDDTEGKHDEK